MKGYDGAQKERESEGRKEGRREREGINIPIYIMRIIRAIMKGNIHNLI